MSERVECWRCGYDYDAGEDIFCPNCDADIEPDKVCPNCGTAYGYDDDDCPNCNVARAKEKIRIASSEPYLAIKCSQCGGALILNETKMAGYCEHCGTHVVANPDIIKPTIKSNYITFGKAMTAQSKHIKTVISDAERSKYKRFKNGINFQNSIDAALPRCPFCGRMQRWEWHIKSGSPKNGTGFRCAICFSKIKVRYGFKKKDSLFDKIFKNKPVRTVEIVKMNGENINGLTVGKLYDIDEIAKMLFIEKP